MLEGTKIKTYSISKLLSNSDYLCFDEFSNLYLLIPNHFPSTHQQQNYFYNFPFTISFFDCVEKQQISYSCYQLSSHLEWIGNLPSMQFKSQIFCLAIIYNFINKVIKPMVEKGINPYSWIHLHNLWFCSQNHQIHLLLHERQKANEGVSKSLYGTPEVLRKIAKILIPLFRINIQNSTFLSILMKSLLSSELSIESVCEILSSKKSRKKFMAKAHHIQAIPARQDPDMSLKLNFCTQNLKTKRRSLRYEKPAVHRHDKKPLTARNSIDNGVPPSFYLKHQTARTTRMFHPDKTYRSLSKSRSKKHKSFHAQKSIELTHRTLLTPEKMYYVSNDRMKNLSETIKARVLKKYHDTIESDKKPTENIKLKDEELRKIIKTRLEVSSLKQKLPKVKQSEEVKKVLFETIEVDRQVEKQNFHKKQIQKMRQIQQKEEQLKRRQKIAQQKEEQLEREREEFEKRKREATMKKQDEIQKLEELRQQQKEKYELELKKQKQIQERKDRKIQEMIKEKEEEEKPQKKEEVKQKTLQLPLQDKNIHHKSMLDLQKEKKPLKNDVSYVEVVQIDELKKVEDEGKTQKFGVKSSRPPSGKEVKKQKIPTKRHDYGDDEIDVVVLDKKKPENKSQVKVQIEKQKKSEKKQIKNEGSPTKKREANVEQSQFRTKTNESSNGSSYGPKKPVSKIVNEYVIMINKMGQGAAKSAKMQKKLEGVEWFVGIYFVYKRFLFERKKILKWLETGEAKLTRYGKIEQNQWQRWYSTEERVELMNRIKAQNETIVSSIIKMHKKLSKKNLKGNILYYAELQNYSSEQSKIAASQIIKQYDSLDEKQMLGDKEVFTHICELMNSLYIIAQLDEKIENKKSLLEITKTKRTGDELEDLVQELYQMFLPKRQ